MSAASTENAVSTECSDGSSKVACKVIYDNGHTHYTGDISMQAAKNYCISEGSSLVAPADPKKMKKR